MGNPILRAGFRILLAVILLLSGCVDAKPDEVPVVPFQSPTATPPAVSESSTPDVEPAPSPEPPGEAYNKSVGWRPEASPTTPTMEVGRDWKTLSFGAQYYRTFMCSAVAAEPAGTGPEVVFRSPSGEEVRLAMGALNECNPTGAWSGAIGTKQTATAENEVGEWSVTVLGRGYGASINIVVVGE